MSVSELPPTTPTAPPDTIPGGAAPVHTGLPPGPRWPKTLQTIALGSRPVWFARWCQARFGDVFTVYMHAVGSIVVVARPEDIRSVFTGEEDVLHAGEANAIMEPMLGEGSLLLLDGERHLRHRRMLLPPFHGEAVRAYSARVQEIAAAEIGRWPVGEEFPLRPRLQAITLEVILRAVIGVSDSWRLERLRLLLPKMLGMSSLEMWAFWSFPWLAETAFMRRFSTLRFRAEIDRLLYAEIAEHRERPSGREDVLALLVQARDEHGEPLSDTELRDHVLTLILAGHETTTTALAWCFERLLRHPAALARLRGEVDRGEEDFYTEAVVNETLRVRPVIDAVWRRLKAPVQVAGHLLPEGATVMPSIVLAQDSLAFPDARAFRPERFLEGSPEPYTFIPFGGGRRRCLGASFALMEMKVILRTILRAVELEAPDPREERTRVQHITLVPARGARVRVTARRPR